MSDAPASAACGCCGGGTHLAALAVENRPGLSALAFRAGTHARFKEAMLAELSTRKHLGELTTRDDSDPSIALLDAWATVLDVLTFYQERIANEGYLRTATERRSILELARTIGYELGPGVAASTWLAFTLDDSPGAPREVAIPAGTRAQSLPSKIEFPQTFETGEEVLARPEWNALKPVLAEPQRIGKKARQALLAGAALDLKPGDALLWMTDEEHWDFSLLTAAEARPADGFTRVAWAEGLAGIEADKEVRVFVLRQRAALFGHNAPDWKALPLETRKAYQDPPGVEWPNFKNKIKDQIELDTEYPKIVVGSWLVLRLKVEKEGLLHDELRLFEVRKTDTTSRAAFALSSKRTRLGLAPEVPERENLALDPREAAVFAQSEELFLAPLPVRRPVAGAEVTLDRRVEGLAAGRPVIVRGKRIRARVGPNPLALRLEGGAGEVGLDPGETLEVLALPRLHEFAQVWALRRRDGTEGVVVVPILAAPEGPGFLEPPRHPRLPPPLPVPDLSDFRRTPGFIRSPGAALSRVAAGAGLRAVPRAFAPESGPILRAAGGPGLGVSVLQGIRVPPLLRLPPDIFISTLPPRVARTPGIEIPPRPEEIPEDPLALAPAEEDDPMTAEVAFLKTVEPGSRTTSLELTAPLARLYDPATVVVHANVGKATHGETRREVLGSADAARPFQRFRLRQKPLTYVPAPVASGGASTLELRVNGVRWREAPDLLRLTPRDRAYVLRRDDDGNVTVQLGDGVHGARPASGVENVEAVYRAGIGAAGAVGEDRITLLATRPLGVRSVTNPLAAMGAADPETRDQARRHAPRTVLTLDRVVSLRDFEDFARGFAGIGKAQARLLWKRGRRTVHLTVAAVDGRPLDGSSEPFRNLVAALDAARDPHQALQVESFDPVTFRVRARLAIHPDHRREDVLARGDAALRQAFAFAVRDFGQGVALSDIMAVLQRVEGAEGVDVEALHRADAPPSLEPRIFALPARLDPAGEALPGQILLLAPGPVPLEVLR